MLQICAKFADTFSLTFNCKKSMCIKFSDNVNANEIIKLNDSQIPWVKEKKSNIWVTMLTKHCQTSQTVNISCLLL